MRIIDCIQGEPAWLEARCGKITASRIADVLYMLKSGAESQARKDYRVELVAERLTHRSADHYVSNDMVWGSENERFARAAYEIETGAMVDTLGFVLHPEWDFAGSSPDGLVGDKGGLEIKCPKTTTHVRYIQEGVVPEEYRPQMYWNMVCCERTWWDFLSFDPRLPDGLNCFIMRLERDEKEIARISDAVLSFEQSICALIDELSKRIKPKAEQPKKDAYAELMELIDQEIIP